MMSQQIVQLDCQMQIIEPLNDDQNAFLCKISQKSKKLMNEDELTDLPEGLDICVLELFSILDADMNESALNPDHKYEGLVSQISELQILNKI